MNIIERIQAPTPTFFKKVRKIGMILTGISGAVLAAPLYLPDAVVTVATYLGIVGSVATVISQAATEADVTDYKKMKRENESPF